MSERSSVADIEWVDDQCFRIGAIEFVHAYERGSTSQRFHIRKRRELVERYAAMVAPFVGGTLVELGIANGGSTAMLALLARPRRLVALEYSPTPVAGLDAFRREQHLADVVRPHYGVDQGDAPAVRAVVADELGDEPLDLVIDDASHELVPTRTSFEVLFPRLRPGGLFVIEDWRWQHLLSDGIAAAIDGPGGEEVRARMHQHIESEGLGRSTPLSRLVVELLVARASSSDVVGDLEVNDHWVTVRRGPAAVDPDRFRLDDLYVDRFGLLGADAPG